MCVFFKVTCCLKVYKASIVNFEISAPSRFKSFIFMQFSVETGHNNPRLIKFTRLQEQQGRIRLFHFVCKTRNIVSFAWPVNELQRIAEYFLD